VLAGLAVFPGTVQAQGSQHDATSQQSQAAQPTQTVPILDGGAGPCSLELTVTTVDNTPIYDAAVKVHIAYGFAGIRRLDLQAGTNTDGKVKFIGLPSRVHQPPLEFQASKDQLVGLATYDPEAECQGNHFLILDKPKLSPSE